MSWTMSRISLNIMDNPYLMQCFNWGSNFYQPWSLNTKPSRVSLPSRQFVVLTCLLGCLNWPLVVIKTCFVINRTSTTLSELTVLSRSQSWMKSVRGGGSALLFPRLHLVVAWGACIDAEFALWRRIQLLQLLILLQQFRTLNFAV